MSDWVDLQLSHQLAPMKAPDQLWERIERPARRRNRTPRLLVATAAAILAVIAVAYSSTRPHEIHRASSAAPGSCNLCHTM